MPVPGATSFSAPVHYWIPAFPGGAGLICTMAGVAGVREAGRGDGEVRDVLGSCSAGGSVLPCTPSAALPRASGPVGVPGRGRGCGGGAECAPGWGQAGNFSGY